MADSISNVLGIHVVTGLFGSGSDFDLFRLDGGKPGIGRASIILGRNGSGKTTIATQIASLRNTSGDSSPYFYGVDGSSITLGEKDRARIRVFGEQYVRDKVYIEKDGLDSIVMLGTQAEASRRINELDREIIELGKCQLEYESAIQSASEGPQSQHNLEAAAKKMAKDGGWSTRRAEIDGGNPNLTKQRWEQIVASQPVKSRENLQHDYEHGLAELKRASDVGVEISGRVPAVPFTKRDEMALLSLLSRELDEPVLTDREQRILALVQQGNQRLVEMARDTFASPETDTCPLCQQHVSAEHKASLLESILKVLNEIADEYKQELGAARLLPLEFSEGDVFGDIPNNLLLDYRSSYNTANALITRYNSFVDQRLKALYTPIRIDSLGLSDAIAHLNDVAATINSTVESINATIRQRDELRQRLRDTSDQIARIDAGDQIALWEDASSKLEEARKKLQHAIAQSQALNEERKKEQARISMTEIAADVINAYLANVYFDSSRFTLVPSGDVYKLRSHGVPVLPEEISTGERNILGLCYFFSEGGEGRFRGHEDDDAQLVVLDDPVSSFDMENRIGVCSLIRSRAAHILAANQESKVMVMTHDMSVAAELEHIFKDISDSVKGSGAKLQVSHLELRGGRMLDLKLMRGEYATLLKRAYDFAISEQEDLEESYVIGNVLRRILEGYASFNYCLGIDAIARDKSLSARFGSAAEVLSSIMYRLALNDESHMQERLIALSPAISFERYSFEEKRVAAQCVLVILDSLDDQHLAKHLAKDNVAAKDLSRSIKQWKARFTSGS